MKNKNKNKNTTVENDLYGGLDGDTSNFDDSFNSDDKGSENDKKDSLSDELYNFESYSDKNWKTDIKNAEDIDISFKPIVKPDKKHGPTIGFKLIFGNKGN